jgi:hypothetical protein
MQVYTALEQRFGGLLSKHKVYTHTHTHTHTQIHTHTHTHTHAG